MSDEETLWQGLAREGHSIGYVRERDRILQTACEAGIWSGTTPLSEHQITSLLTRLAGGDLEGGALDPRRVLGALRGVHAERGWRWPDCSQRVELVARALEKRRAQQKQVAREEGTARLITPRQPITAAMLRAWVERGPPSGQTELWVWMRDTALLLVGFRALLRAGEIHALRLGDVDLSARAQNKVTIIKRLHKTDPTGRSEIRIPIVGLEDDPVCPVRALLRWLDERQRWWTLWTLRASASTHTDAGFVFPQLTEPQGSRGKWPGDQLTTSDIGKVIKRMAHAVTGSHEGFKGHSLRIGGATAMYAAGKSDADIMLVGGWLSEAFRRYLRGEDLVARGLTDDMMAGLPMASNL